MPAPTKSPQHQLKVRPPPCFSRESMGLHELWIFSAYFILCILQLLKRLALN